MYYGDWKRDANLSKCGPLTRGIWIDLICDMHDLDQCGELTGTIEQLARCCRCSPDQMDFAAKELLSTQTAIVTNRNGKIKIINRRMKNEYNNRKDNKIRQMRYRKKNNNENIQESNEKVTVPSSTSTSTSSSKHKKNTKKKFRIPTLAEVDEYCKKRNNKINAQVFINFYESKDWMIGKNKMKSWEACIRGTWEGNENEHSKKFKREHDGKTNAERIWKSCKSSI